MTTIAVTTIAIIGSERSFQAALPFSTFPSQKEFAHAYRDLQDKYLYEQRWENGEARKITIASR